MRQHLDPRAGEVCGERAGGLAPGGSDREGCGTGEEPEVDRRVVRDRQQPARALPARPVVDVVLDAGTPGDHEVRGGAGPVGRHHPCLVGGRAGERQHDQATVLGAPGFDHEPLVVLLEDEDVRRRVGAQPVAPDLVGPHGVVDPGVEDRGVVAGPREPVGGVGDGLRLLGAAGLACLLPRPTRPGPAPQVAEPQLEALGARRVDGEGQPRVVGAHGEVGHLQVVVVAGQLVLVEDDLLAGLRRLRHGRLSACGPAAAVDGVALALDRALVVPPGPVADGHRQVGLDDVVPQLLVDVLAQGSQTGQLGLGVVVLLRQVGEDLGIVAVAQPVPVVDALVPVGPQDRRAARRHRGLHHVAGRRGARGARGPRAGRHRPPAWHRGARRALRRGGCFGRRARVVTISVGEMCRAMGCKGSWPLLGRRCADELEGEPA